VVLGKGHGDPCHTDAGSQGKDELPLLLWGSRKSLGTFKGRVICHRERGRTPRELHRVERSVVFRVSLMEFRSN